MNALKEELQTSDKPVFKIIQKAESFKVIAIGLNTGVVLKKHKAPARAKLVVVQGKVDYCSDRETAELKPFDEYNIPLDEFHELQAHEPSVCLLIVG
ncbi:MAG: hypothetical protein ACPGEC_03740 [Flavobacteriales bacterium]